jgi:hypothetical protein
MAEVLHREKPSLGVVPDATEARAFLVAAALMLR